MDKIGAKMVRVAYEWMDPLVSAYVASRHPGDTVIALYCLGRNTPEVWLRSEVSRLIGGTEAAGWGCVTAFVFPDEETGRKAFETLSREAKGTAERIFGGKNEPVHIDLYRHGVLVDRTHL